MQDIEKPQLIECLTHKSPIMLVCIEPYCGCESRVLCTNCKELHERHQLLPINDGMQMLADYQQVKQSTYNSTRQYYKKLLDFKIKVFQQLQEIEKSIKDALDQLKSQEALDCVMLQYLDNSKKQPNLFEYDVMALYLSSVAIRQGFGINLDTKFNIWAELSNYSANLLEDVSTKLNILSPIYSVKRNDAKVFSIKQYQDVSGDNRGLLMQSNTQYLTTIIAEQQAQLIGFLQPFECSSNDYDNQIIEFKIHEGTQLTNALYTQQISIDAKQQDKQDNCYRINIKPFKLDIYKEYTLSLCSKNGSIWVQYFSKQAATNPYISFISNKKDSEFILPTRDSKIKQDQGLFPIILIIPTE